MEEVSARLTVFFDEPFWVGVYERTHLGGLEAARIVFGAEPKDYEVKDALLEGYGRLRFSPAVEAERSEEHRVNPKRMQREVRKQVQTQGVGTKAQQALKLQQEQGKLAHKALSREQRDERAQQQFELRQSKKREKRKGH